MSEPRACSNCGEELPEEPIHLGDLVYCCQACAFEASRSKDCGGRTDSTFSDAVIEMPKAPDSSELEEV